MERVNQTNSSYKFVSLDAKIKQLFKVYDYTSKHLRNELIRAVTDKIHDHIKSMVDNTGKFSVLIDECKDKADHKS